MGHYGCLVLPAYFKTLVMMNAYCLKMFSAPAAGLLMICNTVCLMHSSEAKI